MDILRGLKWRKWNLTKSTSIRLLTIVESSYILDSKLAHAVDYMAGTHPASVLNSPSSPSLPMGCKLYTKPPNLLP